MENSISGCTALLPVLKQRALHLLANTLLGTGVEWGVEGVPNKVAKEQISKAKPCSTDLTVCWRCKRLHVRPRVMLCSLSLCELRALYSQLLDTGTNSLS